MKKQFSLPQVVAVVVATMLIYHGIQNNNWEISWPEFNWPTIPWVTPSGTEQATWVYEQRDHPMPGYVSGALDKLNRRDPPVVAEPFDQDNVPPPRLVAVVAAAKAEGLPALVLSAKNGKVIKVIKGADLTSEEAILEAVP